MSVPPLDTAWIAFAAHDANTAAKALATAADSGALTPPLRALALHEQALARFLLGEAALGQALLSAASKLEAEAGLTHSKGHTLHQSSLLVHHRGDLERTASYYRETIANLKRMKHDVGLALCQRSLGLLALARGDREGAALAWIDAQERFARHHAGEAACVQAWLEALQGPER